MADSDLIEVLSKVSGIAHSEIRLIAEEVVANNKLLNSCSKHVFSIYNKKTRKHTCAHCKGKVSTVCKRWYEKGIAHEAARKV